MRSVAASSIAIVFALSCSSDRVGGAPISLQILAPKGLIDGADAVSLDVYAGSSCNGPDVVDGATKLESHALSRAGSSWSVSFQEPIDPATELTWYVEGSTAGSKSFRGCTVHAVDQNPLTIDIQVLRYLAGATCGDGIISPPETCDPGAGGVSDESCDATACSTKELHLSNGTAANLFFRGAPGRKTGLNLRWVGAHFYGAWSDATAGGTNGGDGSAEITWRRLVAPLVTDTSVAVLANELRLQSTENTFSTTGDKERNGAAGAPTLVQVEGGNILVVLDRSNPSVAPVPQVFFTVQAPNMGPPASADVQISPSSTAQTGPSADGTGGGDALVAWVEGTSVKCALRASGGALGAVQSLGTAVGSATSVGWLGGNYVVAWSDGDDVKAHLLDAKGAPTGSEIVANAVRLPGKQDQPVVAGLPSGEFMIVWRDSGGEGDVGADIRGQRFDATGAAVGNEVAAAINDTSSTGDQVTPTIAGSGSLGTHFYAIAWIDSQAQEVHARYVDATNGGFLVSPDGQTSEFAATLSPRVVSTAAITIGATAPSQVVIGWVDEVVAAASGDDDRVRARWFPIPTQ